MSRLRVVLSLVLVMAVFGLARAQDVVSYFDRVAKKDQEYKGTIEEETSAGIKIKVKAGKDTESKFVPAASISRVFYQHRDVTLVEYRQAFGKEERARTETGKTREKFLAEALERYTKLEQLLRGNPNPRRYFQFKIAEVTALQAQSDPAKAEQAIKLLTDFKTAHANGWQITEALKMLAKLLENSGKLDDARKTYEELADLPDIPAGVKLESGILVGRLLLRGGKYVDAEKRLRKLSSTLSAGDAQAPFVKAYLAESRIGQNSLATVQKDLEEVIKGTGDAQLRGLAYNLLGDYYTRKGQPEEAFWQYLRVDALYNEDVEEHAKALYRLASLFDKVKKDPIRGKECAARLMDSRFAGTAYQQKLARESKKTP